MKYIISICFLLFLNACQAPALKRFSVYTYAEEKPIVLNVSDVVLQSEIQRYDRLPHIEE